MLQESAFSACVTNPLNLLRIPYWLSQGKAALKQHLAKHTAFDPSALPYNQALIAWLKEEKAAGRKLILCTASDQAIANAIADHLGFFDEVMASDGIINLAASHKAHALVKRFGEKGFDYVGNSHDDLKVWQCARLAIVVNASSKLAQKAAACCPIAQRFPKAKTGFKLGLKVLRVHQWLKNSLLFIPFIAAHQLLQASSALSFAFAFFSFSLCASAVYIANDLIDVESDRLHPRKCRRPFAAGLIPVWFGVLLSPLLLIASLILAHFVGGSFLPWLIFYFSLTCAYSLGLKRLVLVDCLTLAILYTLRLVAGAAAIAMPLSFWLLAFSVFLFLSLAFVKRYAELQVQMHHGKSKAHGRGYHTTDAPLIQILGISAGYAAALVLALYLNSDSVIELYRAPEYIWGTVPVILFWVSWMWLQAHRGCMHDDPLVFAVKDHASLIAGAAFIAILIFGTVGLPW